MSDRIRTALLGGTFNPLHNGHLTIAQSVLDQHLADEVWMLITPCNPWKTGQDLLDDRIRYDMVASAVKDIPGIQASDFEFSLPKPSYTANTLRSLSASYPDREFILTIGADNWVKFDAWREYDFILRNYSIIVYPRQDYPIEQLSDNVTLLDCPLMDVSSTRIRQLVKQGQSIDNLVPRVVASIIRQNNLYK